MDLILQNRLVALVAELSGGNLTRAACRHKNKRGNLQTGTYVHQIHVPDVPLLHVPQHIPCPSDECPFHYICLSFHSICLSLMSLKFMSLSFQVPVFDVPQIDIPFIPCPCN